MASSANLVANLTKTNLYTNIQNMLKTSISLLYLVSLYTSFISAKANKFHTK
ncbi:hypothetical protein PL321_08655 [Caloramator sp. mosi_1]|nr:hypothetical protein [Caloramator sp. mosi_1]WDC85697.1 hypothetical protein PL321_08655 [Caloramator sp. mosi_1]